MSRTDTHVNAVHYYKDQTEPIGYKDHVIIRATNHQWHEIGKHYAKPRAAKSIRRNYRATLRQAERAYAREAKHDPEVSDARMFVRGTRPTIMWDCS